jgi:hypothetical protein
MRIEPTQNLIAGLEVREQSPSRTDTAKNDNIPPETAQGDRIDIGLKSALSIAKAMLEGSQIAPELHLTPERTTEIQNRVKSGFYGTDHVLSQAGDGILELYTG